MRRDDAESPARPIAARAPHATRTRTLPVALTADAPGTVSFALVCAGRVAAQGTAKLAAAGTVGFRLKLPKKLKAGIYQLKITFGGNARTIKITFAGAKKARKARAAAAAPLIDAASAPVGVPTGEMPHAPASRSVNFSVR